MKGVKVEFCGGGSENIKIEKLEGKDKENGGGWVGGKRGICTP